MKYKKTEKEKQIEIYLALFTMMIAIVNIILIFMHASLLFRNPFSMGLSVMVFYYGWRVVTENEYFERMQTLLLLHHLDKEAEKKAKEIVENVEQECQS